MCKDKTFSIQIVAVGGSRQQIQVPVFGHYKCSLTSVWFYSPSNIAGGVDIIRLNSPQFRLKYSSAVSYLPNGSLNSELSSQPYPVFLSTPSAQVGGLQGAISWEYNFQGVVELQVENLTGVMYDSDYCIVNIDLSPVHSE